MRERTRKVHQKPFAYARGWDDEPTSHRLLEFTKVDNIYWTQEVAEAIEKGKLDSYYQAISHDSFF